MAKIVGAVEFAARLRNSSPKAVQLLQDVLFEAGMKVQTDAQQSITDGAISGAGHIPSAPGEPPNNDTGVLANNIETLEAGPLKVTVSSNAPYAAPLEFGTSRMAARPYMGPAFEKNKKRIINRLTAAVNQANRTR